VEGSAALLRQTSALMVGDVAGSQAVGSRALALYPEAADPGRAVANINLGLTFYFAGDLTGAEAALRNGLQRLPGAGWSFLHAIGLGQLALARLDQGDVEDARAIMADAERHIAEGRVDEAQATSAAVLARGRGCSSWTVISPQPGRPTRGLWCLAAVAVGGWRPRAR